MSIHLKEISVENQQALFKLAINTGNNFISEDWIRDDGSTIVLGVFSNSDLIGGAILARTTLKGVSALLNVHGMPHLAMFIDPSSIKNPNMKVSERDLGKALASWLASRKEKIKLIRFAPSFKDLLPLYWADYILQTKYTYQIDLTQPREQLWNQLNSKLRAGVKKVNDTGCEYSETHQSEAEKLILKANGGLNKKNQKLIETTLRQLSQSSHSALSVLIENGNPAAAACTYVNNETMYYLFGGANKDKSGYGAALIWQSILKAQEAGLKKFDFEGSMLPGVEKFFRQFGGELTPYLTATQAPLHFEVLMKIMNKS